MSAAAHGVPAVDLTTDLAGRELEPFVDFS